MYPFLTNGIKMLGGLSAAPKNIDSFCGMFVNLIFATASQLMKTFHVIQIVQKQSEHK